MNRPTADVSVRVAWAADALGIARVQVEAWQQVYAGQLPDDILAGLDAEAFAATWSQALAKPGDARNRVLVALERNRVVGFAVTSPAGDPDADPVADGQVGEFHVLPGEQRLGHGSRLLQACADTLAADRFTRAVFWVNSSDDVLRAFLEESGWAPDSAHRELDLHGDGAVQVKQVRLHTTLSQ